MIHQQEKFFNENFLNNSDEFFFDEEKFKLNLPEDFYRNIIELENELNRDNKNLNNEIISDLSNLYKLGVEYFSEISIEKKEFYHYKLQNIFTNKNIFKKTSERFSTLYQGYSNKGSTADMSDEIKNIRNDIDDEEMKKKNEYKNDYEKKKIYSQKIEKFLTNFSLRKKINNYFIDFEKNFEKGIEKIENDITNQNKKYIEIKKNKKKKNYRKIIIKSERKSSDYTSRKNSIDSNNILQNLIKKNSNNSIENILEEYIKKNSIIYYTQQMEKSINLVKSTYYNNCELKIKTFFKHEDQIKQFELLKNVDESYSQNINLIIDSLILERNTQLLKIDKIQIKIIKKIKMKGIEFNLHNYDIENNKNECLKRIINYFK